MIRLKQGTSIVAVMAMTLSLLLVQLSAGGSAVVHASGTKLTLTTSMVTNESGLGDATMLVDEQSLAGDPAGGTGGSPATRWFPGWNANSYPASAYIDLGAVYDLTDIYLFDTNGINDLTVSYGSPGNWTTLFVDPLSSYLTWKAHPVNVTTQYIRLTKAGPTSNVEEIVLYGTPSGSPSDTTPPSAIDDLRLGYASSSSVHLSWTTPGDDGDAGTAVSYDIRYSTSPITSLNFASATPVPAPPSPYPGGYDQAMNVTGLSPSTTYYFAMRASDEANNASDVSNVPSITTASGAAGAKIVLDASMVVNPSISGDATLLVDEQAVSGDPKNGAGGSPTTSWFPGWGDHQYPAHAIIDLGVEYELDDIYIYDANGTGLIELSTGTPGNWTLQASDTLGNYMSWNQHSLSNVTTRYVQVTLVNNNTREIVLYGTPTGTPSPALPPAPVPYTPSVTFDEFVGINGFIDDPIDKLAVAGSVREYHNWQWDEDATRTLQFEPSRAGGGNWYFDTYYEDLNQAGIDVLPSLMGSTTWLTGNRAYKPVPSGYDPEDPASYQIHAEYLFQYAARYGSQSVNDNLLRLNTGQPRVSGLGTIQYFEDWNEQDATWNGADAYFTPFEYAAMASADYDGHLGTMGADAGVKTADPGAKMAMSGLAGIEIDYIDMMKYWSDFHRGGDFPADVLNVHTYVRNEDHGISPEEGELRAQLEALVKYRDQYLPGKEVWLTEFGYDTNPNTAQAAPAIGTFSNEEVQGQWLVRSYLELAASGIDRAYQYMLRDVDPDSWTQYSSSGLVSSKDTGHVPKISWYYVYTMKNTLAGMKYAGEVDSGNPNVKIYKFKDSISGEGAYAVWASTSNQTTVSQYALTLEGSPTAANLVEMVNGDTDGVSSALTITGGQVEVDVSERPVFVLVDQMP